MYTYTIKLQISKPLTFIFVNIINLFKTFNPFHSHRIQKARRYSDSISSKTLHHPISLSIPHGLLISYRKDAFGAEIYMNISGRHLRRIQ